MLLPYSYVKQTSFCNFQVWVATIFPVLGKIFKTQRKYLCYSFFLCLVFFPLLCYILYSLRQLLGCIKLTLAACIINGKVKNTQFCQDGLDTQEFAEVGGEVKEFEDRGFLLTSCDGNIRKHDWKICWKKKICLILITPSSHSLIRFLSITKQR